MKMTIEVTVDSPTGLGSSPWRLAYNFVLPAVQRILKDDPLQEVGDELVLDCSYTEPTKSGVRVMKENLVIMMIHKEEGKRIRLYRAWSDDIDLQRMLEKAHMTEWYLDYKAQNAGSFSLKDQASIDNVGEKRVGRAVKRYQRSTTMFR